MLFFGKIFIIQKQFYDNDDDGEDFMSDVSDYVIGDEQDI